MKILLTGVNGQVGWELERALMPVGSVISISRDRVDLTNQNELRKCIQDIKPDIIVNPAAYTAVDAADNDRVIAFKVNSEAPEILAEEAKKLDALMVHYSTDYIFDGKKIGPYHEDDIPNPLNVYGESKLAGELAICDHGIDYLIFRTSWVFSTRGKNFLNTILRLASERNELSIVADQLGTPTWSRLIAETTACCIRQAVQLRKESGFSSGIYNLTARNNTSWYEFAREIINNASNRQNLLSIENIKPIPSCEYPTPAQRPINSCLDITKLESEFSLEMPTWQETLKYCMAG